MIRIDLDVMLARRKRSLTELSQRVGITLANLSILKTGKAMAVRFQTLDAICRALDCQPGDLLIYEPGKADSGAYPPQSKSKYKSFHRLADLTR